MQQDANEDGAVMRRAVPRLWELLIAARAAGGDPQYDYLEQQLGLTRSQLIKALDGIAGYCIAKEVPLLPVLAVGADGIPGPGFRMWHPNPGEARAAVVRYNWESMHPPAFPPIHPAQ